jgi:uncharacterized protein (DUF1778 family)
MASVTLQKIPRGRISARVPQHVVDVLELAADMVGATLNQFVTQAALEKAEQIVEQERRIRLSEISTAQIFNLLDNPPVPNTALTEAIASYQARKVSNAGSDSIFEFNP